MSVMDTADLVEAFWQECLQVLPECYREYPLPEAWGFGNSPQMADELCNLVLEGIKVATCSLLWEYEQDGVPIPRSGDLSIILDGQGKPGCLIETTRVNVRPFNGIDQDWARLEGEGDLSLEYWRKGHWHYNSVLCEQIGRTPTEDMPLVCEEFRVLVRGKTD